MGLWLGILLLTPSLNASPFQSDFTSDGIVDLGDFVLFANTFGSASGSDRYDPLFDLTGDGAIGFGDFLVFVLEFGQSIDCGNDPGMGPKLSLVLPFRRVRTTKIPSDPSPSTRRIRLLSSSARSGTDSSDPPTAARPGADTAKAFAIRTEGMPKSRTSRTTWTTPTWSMPPP